jgi:hypothetical protein
MPSFGEQLLTRAIQSSIADESRKRKALEKIETDKLSLLADPAKLDRLVADFTTMVSPSKAKLGTDFASKTDAAEANIPSDHPLKGYGTTLKENLQVELRNPENRGYSTDEIVLALAKRNLNPLIEKSHEYKYRKDYAPTNWFGFAGEDEDVKALPGYEEFKERQAAITPEEISTTYKEALGFGGGLAVAGQLGRRAAIKWGGKRLVSWGTKRLVTGAALGPHVGLAALAAIPAFKIFDATANIINKSHFGKSQGAVNKLAVEMILGGLVPAYAGHKFLTKSITAAAKADLIKGTAEKLLMRLPTSRNAITLGRAKALAAKEAVVADAAMAKEAAKPSNKRMLFKAADDEYTRNKFDYEGMSKFEKGGLERDLAAPFSSQFTGAKTARKKSVGKIFAQFTDEQSDAALAKAKDVGIRKATIAVKEGVDVLEDQRLKEIRDGIYKGLKEVDRYQIERYTTDDLLAPFKSKKKTRLVAAGEKKVKKTKKVAKNVNDAVDKEILAAKIAELNGDIEASRSAIAAMGERFEKTGLYKTKTGKTVLKKGGKKKGTEQVPDEVVEKKMADAVEANKTVIPEGTEEISYQEAKKRLLASMMDKNAHPVKKVLLDKSIENAEKSIESQVWKQQGRKLTEAEMSDAEWLARAGESETIEDIYATSDGLIKEEFDPSKWKFFFAGAAVIPLLSLFSPGEAEASMGGEVLKVAAGSKVPKFVVDSLKAAGRSLKGMRKEIIDGGYVYIPPAEGQKFFGERMKAISVSEMVAERGEKLIDQVIRAKSLPFGLDRAMGVGGFSNLFFKAGGGPGVELGSRHIVNGWMTKKGIQVLDNILGDVKGYDANPKVIIEAMQPLADRFAGQVGAYNAVEYQIKNIKGIRNKLIKQIKRKQLKGVDKQEAIVGIEEANASLKQLDAAVKELAPAAKQFSKDYDETVKLLAKDNPSVRMSLAAEDTVDFKYNSWLEPLMTFEEKEAVGYHKKFMEEYAEEIARVYGKDAIIESKPYVHHAFHPNWQTKFINDELDRLKLKISPHPPYTEFHSRARYSKQMVPHIGYNTGRYIPDAEKRLMMGEFWGRGKPNSWYALMKNPIIQGSDALRQFFRRIHDASIPASDHWSNRAANWYSAIEVFRLLGFSTSVAFKHLFKIPGTWAQLGFSSAIKHVPESIKVFSRTYAKGSEGKAIAKYMNLSGAQGEKAATDLIAKTFSRQYGYMNTIMDMDMAVNVNSTFETGLKWANEKGGVLVRAVEHFDRVHGVLAASEQAAKKGMTAKQAVYGLVDTVLKNNFLSGVLNPSWMRNPKMRALFLFQNTAFKIAERRVVGAIKTLELSKAAGRSIKEKGLRQTLTELKGIKQFIKEGEHEFKESIILDALNADRGYFGTPQSVQFMKEILIMGAILGAGGVGGVDLWEHVNHIPFLKGHTRYPTLATSPIMNAIFDTTANRAAAARASKAPEFMLTDFLKEWLWQGKYGPYPQSVKKLMRLSNNDIPDRYKDTWWKYLFSIPSTE